MPTTCIFQLDRLDPIYSSGEYINGRILLQTDKVKRVRAVYVTLEGEAKVQWSMSGKSEAANYYGHQQYLYSRTNVFDSSEFPVGTHVYVLTLRIPPDCPSSCTGPYGYIGYNISLIVEKPWSFDEVFRKPVTVMQALDLNYNPEYSLPIRDEHIKYFCRWPCASGPILYNLLVPQTGFVANQCVPFILEVDNQSPHYDVGSVEVTLKQNFIFLAHKPVKRNYFTKTLARTIFADSTLRLTKRIYSGEIRVPPHTPRSTVNASYIVFLHYTLQVKLKTGPLHFDSKLQAPLVIGTVPLRVRQGRGALLTTVTMAATPSSAMATVASSTNFGSTATSIEAGADAEDEPPSYDDSCLPPSFSFATLGSQQTLDSTQSGAVENQQRINLPEFPGYNTIASRPQVERQTERRQRISNYIRVATKTREEESSSPSSDDDDDDGGSSYSAAGVEWRSLHSREQTVDNLVAHESSL